MKGALWLVEIFVSDMLIGSHRRGRITVDLNAQYINVDFYEDKREGQDHQNSLNQIEMYGFFNILNNDLSAELCCCIAQFFFIWGWENETTVVSFSPKLFLYYSLAFWFV